VIIGSVGINKTVNAKGTTMQATIFVVLGALLAAVGVALGAIGAHALQGRLSPQQLETFRTGVQYQLIHAVGLILVGLLALHRNGLWVGLSGWLMLVGIVLFSGLIYAWLLSGIRGLVHVVPVGGVAFILAWLALAVAALRDLR
jgi:uncharacterized membrane protein YgdD (TMEM256/DUF423 family)